MHEGGGNRPVAGVERVAVLRANALGDFILALPALEAVRAAYPAAEIVLLGAPRHEELLRGRPSPVDRVVIVPPSRGVADGPPASAQELGRFFAAMQRERFDLALQLHGGGRNSNPFVRRLGARVTAGLASVDAEPLDRSIAYRYYHHEIPRLLEVVGLVGAPPVALVPRLAVTDEDLEAAAAAVESIGTPLVALHPGATDARRRWPAESFARVGDALARTGATVVVTGSDEERELVARVRRAMDEPSRGVAGKLGLGGLAGLLSRCALVVSNDTGPRHLAEAVGAATVGVFWCGNLINAGPATRDRHHPLVAWTTRCPACGADALGEHGITCDHRVSFVATVAPEVATEAALDLLPRGRPRSVPRRSGDRLEAA